MKKIKTLPQIKKIIKELKKEEKKIVFTNGCFDILHPGHIKLLNEAKKKGDCLVVGLNSDSSIRRIKGKKRPILNEKARGVVLEAIEVIDYIVFFKEDTPYNLIKEIRPHYLVKGADWKEEKVVGKDLVEKIFLVKLIADYSTTKIIDKIKKYG
ncbi:MAG TPA: D-glycero-beta-D-manno-heptose 1-phosphate adenylyltransferase [Candidatus Omnitrophica bacterium]|nr:D-glycero-beta-D-manno-heptose 1-phosphate adenylyltransferase [Candidatus Omnitrophota bacterium]